MSMNRREKTEQYAHVPTDWGVSKTKQSAAAECDINNIIRRAQTTGQLEHITSALAQYRDISGIPDLETAMNIVADAKTSFEELPAEIRKRVGHDVANFLPFIDDPENFEECVEMGLLAPKPQAKTVPTVRDAKEDPAVPDEKESPVQGGE